MIKKKTVTILIITATVILAGIAIFTAIRLYQLRQQSVVPTRPESEPAAQEGDFCGGIAGISCPLGYKCQLDDPFMPDSGGICIKETDREACQTLIFTITTSTIPPTGSPTPTSTASPTATPTGEPTPTPTGSPTASPTASPTSSPTATPTGEPTPTPTGSPTPTSTSTVSASASPVSVAQGATPAPSESTLTEAGVGTPTLIGIGVGAFLLLLSLMAIAL